MFARSQEARTGVSQTLTFPAPTAGWVQSGNEVRARPDQAEILDNWIPTAQGARLRGGTSEVDDAEASVVRLFTYNSGSTEDFFAATANDIFDATDVAGGALRTSLTNGDWSVTQISTAGGQFLVGVNGADSGWTYNGSFSDMSWTGVDTADLSQIWVFSERLFAVEANTTSVWYLPVESITGTATEIDLGAVFGKGGNVLFGATWSLDSGAGLDDVCVFATTRGELAVYEGTDPSSADTWRLVGVYEIGVPLDKHAFFKAGGDLMIVTEDGIVPVSAAIKKDRAALQLDAITYAIEDAWKEVIQQRSTAYPITATLWQSGTLLIVGTPGQYKGRSVAFVANARTGAWCRITGWDVRCAAVWQDELYFADAAGKIYKADTGGTDAGQAYTAVWLPKFQTSVDMASVNSIGITYRAREKLHNAVQAHADYTPAEIREPTTFSSVTGSTWGSGVWGTFVWGASSALYTHNEWAAAYANGYALSGSFSITSNQTAKESVELLMMRLRVEKGYAL